MSIYNLEEDFEIENLNKKFIIGILYIIAFFIIYEYAR